MFKPDLANSKEARIPEPPPPMINASNSIVFMLLPKILFIIKNTYNHLSLLFITILYIKLKLNK